MGKEAQNAAPEYDDALDIKDLLKLDDEGFIKKSYSAILKRETDEEGLADYLLSLRDGSMDKIDIIEALRYSGEGKDKNVKIKGLRKFLIIREIYRIPLAGYLLKMTVNLILLPRTLERMQVFQNDIYGRLNVLGKKLNEAARISNRRLDALGRGLNEATQTSNRRLDALGRELNEATQTSDKRLNALGKELNEATAEIKDLDEAAQISNRRLDTLGRELNEAAQTSKENIAKIENSLETKVNNEVAKDIMDDLGDLMGQINEYAEQREALEEKKHLHDAMYVAFEDKFRGTRENIRQRVGIYLKYIKKVKAGTKDAPVIDVGCGRGEWLELLKDNKYSAKGIDLNREMIKACRSRKLEVMESDAVAYLKGLKPESAGAITGFHIAEHIDFENMISLIDESLRVLKKGGILILETPNPENLIVGACNFYMDPTHLNPIPPEALLFIVNNRGFKDTEILRLHRHEHFEKVFSSGKNKELADLFAKEQDYSIIAYKK